jgi:hypothetical protein
MVSRLILFAVLLLAAAPKQSANHLGDIEASVQELTAGFLKWEQHYPGATTPGKPMMIAIPSIDLYSPSGVSLYHGGDSEKNASFIRDLPGNIPHAKTEEVRPSFQEALEMFDALKSQKALSPAGHQYTVFALTYAGADFCKAQNDAIQQLRSRAGQIGIRILEVRLHK